MKRLTAAAVSLLLGLSALAQQLRDIDIVVELQPDGSAVVTQHWDVRVVSGTEWYIPITNLGPMSVSDLMVSENGVAFESVGEKWDVDWSRKRKAGKCGINHPEKGKVELCWGQGEYGDHRWTATFHLGGLVQAYDDYDGFNFMFVNPGLVAAPEHAKLTIRNYPGGSGWTSENTRVWGFGFYGDINVVDGAVVAESSEPFVRGSALIALVRFDKGLFSPTVKREGSFDDLLQSALEGSSYGEDEFPMAFLFLILGIFAVSTGLLLWVIISVACGYKYKKSLFGTSKIEGWFRDIPVQGDLFAAYFVVEHGKRFGGMPSSENLIGALFLKWIMEGRLKVLTDPSHPKRVNLSFEEEAPEEYGPEHELYEMARTASGSNLILEGGEFEKWSEKNFRKVTAWPGKAKAAGERWFRDKGLFLRDTVCSEAGAQEARRVIEFRNFLKEFTLSDERTAAEAALWKNYLVFAQLYGIADKVAEQFRKLYPAQFQEIADSVGVDPTSMMRTIRHTNILSSRVITHAAAKAGSVSGAGGHTSFGGGGGFSGGGFGGGSR